MIGISRSSIDLMATGTAIRKMIRSTSITSTRGVVLISDIGLSPLVPAEIAIAVVLSQYCLKGGRARMPMPAPHVPRAGSGLGGADRRRGGRARGLLGRSRGHHRRLHGAARGDVGEHVGRER